MLDVVVRDERKHRLVMWRATRLRAALDARGMSQAEFQRLLVERTDSTQEETVSNWCRGTSAMTEMQLVGALALLGLPATWRPGDPVPADWKRPPPPPSPPDPQPQ